MSIQIKEIREFMGMSQYKMAELLGVSRGLVNLAEKEKRKLPHKAFIKINAMILLMQQLKTKKHDNADNIDLSSREKLASRHKKKIEFHEKRAASLQAQLDELKKAHATINTRLAMLDALSNNDIEWFSITEPDKKQIGFMEYFAKESLKVSGLTKQEILQDKIEVQLAYAEIHKERWEKFSK